MTAVIAASGVRSSWETSATAARLISAEVTNLARLVEDLIEISRFDAGTARVDRDTVDIAELITSTLRTRGWLDQVDTHLPPGIFASVDRRRVDVIVANLVGNALRHGASPIDVRLSVHNGQINVDVTDHGPGLSSDARDRVFDRFYKADTARTRSEGSGLGLAIALNNARLHDGTIEAFNADGAGARFTLRIPRTGVDS